MDCHGARYPERPNSLGQLYPVRQAHTSKTYHTIALRSIDDNGRRSGPVALRGAAANRSHRISERKRLTHKPCERFIECHFATQFVLVACSMVHYAPSGRRPSIRLPGGQWDRSNLSGSAQLLPWRGTNGVQGQRKTAKRRDGEKAFPSPGDKWPKRLKSQYNQEQFHVLDGSGLASPPRL